MSDPSRHPSDLLLDAVDGRLHHEALASLEVHVALCEQCRRELDALQWTKAHVGLVGRATEVPIDLGARARRWLDEEGDRSAPGAPVPERRRAMAWIAAAAAAAAVIAGILWLQGGDAVGAPDAAASHLRAFQAGALSLELESSDPEALEAHLRATRAPASRVYDFGMMGYTLAGVRTHALGDSASAVAAYRGPDGQALLCEMYVGRVETLPPPAERRTHNDIDFLVYRVGEVTVVFWQEGVIVCVLAGAGEPEAIIALAFAKAIEI